MADRHPTPGRRVVAREPSPRGPVRTCLGCRSRCPQGELLRLRWDGRQVVAEGQGPRGPGRGAYICAKMSCWEKAQRRRVLGRALRLGAGPQRLVEQDAVAAVLAGMISGSPRSAQPAPTAAPP